MLFNQWMEVVVVCGFIGILLFELARFIGSKAKLYEHFTEALKRLKKRTNGKNR